MVKKKQIPELKIVFDTNALYTQAANDLVKPEISQLIKEHSNYADHKMSWYLPEIVRHERQYQMVKSGLALLPSINKLEKLLGHNLGISESILEDRVKQAIEHQLTDLKLHITKIDFTQVNWEKIILDAVYRRPPFDPGEKEKGFRDVMIIESLLQLIRLSPVTPSVCRVVLVSEDKLLADAARMAVSEFSNVRILNTLEELRGLISTLVSEVDESFVEEVQAKAQSYFFTKDDKTALYYKEEVRSKIKEQFSQKLDAKPEGIAESEADTWYIGNPRFVKKEVQRIFWATRIEATFNGYRVEYKSSQSLAQGLLSAYLAANPANKDLASLATSTTPEKKLALKYGVIFEVDWSVTYGQHKKFTSPKIENIHYIETHVREEMP